MSLQNPEGTSVLSAARRLSTGPRPNMVGMDGILSPWQSAFEFLVFWGAALALPLASIGK
jgi:hypothetical protein